MQSVQRLWGEKKFIKVWYNKSHAAGRFPSNDKNEGMHMANGIIFLVGALIMFYMALRSVRQRRSLCTNGEKVQARITGTVQSRDGTAYVLEFTTAGGSHRLQCPNPLRSKNFAEGSVVTRTTTRKPRRKCMWRAISRCWAPRRCTQASAWHCWC